MPVFKRYARRPPLKARDIMSSPPVTVSETASILEAAAVMKRRGIGSLIVVDDSGRIAGIVTERDLINSIASGLACRGGRVGDVMTRNVIVARPDEDLASLVEKMREANVRHIPIVDEDGVPVGVVSVRDVIDLGITALRLFVEP